MFFLVSGGAASGKTTFARMLPDYLAQLVCHDADEWPAADAQTRCAQLERWVCEALNVQQQGQDFLLATHSPLGELLACPSAPQLGGVAACLLDCADLVRIERIRARGIDPRWPPTQATLSWASWHRMHAHDPQWEPQVIVHNGPPSHCYDRWQGWARHDPRWQVLVLDTTTLTKDQTVSALIDWVQDARSKPALLSAATGWADAVE